jgi:hypothetical protein
MMAATMGPRLRPIASAVVRAAALMALAMLVILVVLPAALVAAGIP